MDKTEIISPAATNEEEMQAAVREEWDAIPQEWINSLIDKQEHWVHVLMERFGRQLLIKCCNRP